MNDLVSFYGPELAATASQPLPSDFLPYRACREYFARESGTVEAVEPVGDVGANHACGVRWQHGPFRFEKFITDDEPPVLPGKRRLVLWQRIARTGKVPGWLPGTAGMGFRLTGMAAVVAEKDGGRALQEAGWSQHGKRHAKRWRSLLAAGERTLERLGIEEYLTAYRQAEQDSFIKTFLPKVLRQKARAHGDRMRFWASRGKDGALDAGIVILDIPEANTTLHVGGFIRGNAKRESAAVGLISHSMDECRARGIGYFDFGFFWAPGDPADWKGFSRFKSQFGIRLIGYQKPLWKLVGPSRP